MVLGPVCLGSVTNRIEGSMDLHLGEGEKGVGRRWRDGPKNKMVSMS